MPLTEKAQKKRGRKKLAKCRYGHRMIGKNLYLRENGKRDCRECSLKRARKNESQLALLRRKVKRLLTQNRKLADQVRKEAGEKSEKAA